MALGTQLSLRLGFLICLLGGDLNLDSLYKAWEGSYTQDSNQGTAKVSPLDLLGFRSVLMKSTDFGGYTVASLFPTRFVDKAGSLEVRMVMMTYDTFQRHGCFCRKHQSAHWVCKSTCCVMGTEGKGRISAFILSAPLQN